MQKQIAEQEIEIKALGRQLAEKSSQPCGSDSGDGEATAYVSQLKAELAAKDKLV